VQMDAFEKLLNQRVSNASNPGLDRRCGDFSALGR